MVGCSIWLKTKCGDFLEGVILSVLSVLAFLGGKVMVSGHLGGVFFVEVFRVECVGEMIPDLTSACSTTN